MSSVVLPGRPADETLHVFGREHPLQDARREVQLEVALISRRKSESRPVRVGRPDMRVPAVQVRDRLVIR